MLVAKVYPGHAFTPNESARYGGYAHFILDNSIRYRRLIRGKGDALCRKKEDFWGLEKLQDAMRHPAPGPVCQRCFDLYQRLQGAGIIALG